MTSPMPVQGRLLDRLFYTGLALVAAALVFSGFARTYFLKDYFGAPPLRPLLHLHGVLFSSWLVLLISQTTLVAAKRTDLHRRLGAAGALLAALMVVVGSITAISAARRGVAPQGGPPPLIFMAIPLGDLLVFALLVGAAFYYRRRSEFHKRLMILATLGILPPAIARLPFAFILSAGPVAFFGLADLILVACVLYDFVTRRHVHPAYVWGGLGLVVWQPLRLVVAGTDAWLVFARWLTR